MKLSIPQANLLIAAASLLLFLPFLGSVRLFDWDEINFAECAREMLVSGDWGRVQVDFQPFWEKPPLFLWMQALCMKWLGVGEFAARLPNALCGLATLLLCFNLGCRLKNPRLGAFWCLALTGSFLPFFYFKSGIIDPWFNFFIFAALAASSRHLLLSALCAGLALMTKGPVAWLVLGLCLGLERVLGGGQRPKTSRLLLYGLVALSVGGFWFMEQLAEGRGALMLDFLRYQWRLLRTADAGHGGPFYFHALALLLGCFPASILALPALFRRRSKEDRFGRLMLILFWVVLILFSLVKTKIVHYSSLCLFPLTYFAALRMEALSRAELKWPAWMSYGVAAIGGLAGVVLFLGPLAAASGEFQGAGLKADAFTLASLRAKVGWEGLLALPGALFLAGIAGFLVQARGKFRTRALCGLFLLCLSAQYFALPWLMPKVEAQVQGAALDFYEGLSGRSCYVGTLGFKSYAHLFYARTRETCGNHLLEAPLDKPAYFVGKVTEEVENRRDHPDLDELGRKNGFIFYLRLPARSSRPG